MEKGREIEGRKGGEKGRGEREGEREMEWRNGEK